MGLGLGRPTVGSLSPTVGPTTTAPVNNHGYSSGIILSLELEPFFAQILVGFHNVRTKRVLYIERETHDK